MYFRLLLCPPRSELERTVRVTVDELRRPTVADLAEVLVFKETVEPALRRKADLEIDTSIPLDEVVEQILTFCRAR